MERRHWDCKRKMKLGLITYDYAHLKTEQLVCRYVNDSRIERVEIFALPFVPRKERTVLFQHRPDMTSGLPTKALAELGKVTFNKWDGCQPIHNECDFFVIGGAGILDVEFAKGKPIVNAHPGIIPLTRGLDSFKWAIYNGDPVGVTLHFIDAEVDKGQVLAIKHTPVFSSDTIETLARRHYELEIEMLSNIAELIASRETNLGQEKPATRRMNNETEKAMLCEFEAWKKKILSLGID